MVCVPIVTHGRRERTSLSLVLVMSHCVSELKSDSATLSTGLDIVLFCFFAGGMATFAGRVGRSGLTKEEVRAG